MKTYDDLLLDKLLFALGVTISSDSQALKCFCSLAAYGGSVQIGGPHPYEQKEFNLQV